MVDSALNEEEFEINETLSPTSPNPMPRLNFKKRKPSEKSESSKSVNNALASTLMEDCLKRVDELSSEILIFRR